MADLGAGLIPVTMLSGFLGAGKTTVLRYALQNSAGLKIGCVVNDVAAVNIDAKLIRNDNNKASAANGSAAPESRSTTDLADTIELANGCACCSLQDELFSSFQQLLDLADKNGSKYDRLVLENSGVAEPQNIRDQFAEAVAAGHPITQRIRLDTMATVVDSATFIQDYSSRTPLTARPDLGEGGGFRPVVDLLVEQIECADTIILNKCDALDQKKVDSLVGIAKSLNPLAQVMCCKYGEIPIDQVFGREARALMSMLNVEGQHRGAVAAALEAKKEEAAEAELGHSGHHHEHGHEHSHGKEHSNEHGHGHDHGHNHGPHGHHHGGDHSHEHGHDHADCQECKEGHEHGHSHEHHQHQHDHACGEDCKEDHAHGHEHGPKAKRQDTSAAKRFGIRSFVYSRRRPFHPQRLRELVLRWLPVSNNAALAKGQAPAQGDSPVKSVLRSKGFMWMANSHATAFYWSHAGQHFEIRDEGDWWVVVPEEDWPEARLQRDVILADFDLTSDYGDRRQEIVFIGANMDEDAICRQLDTALLTDEEMQQYASTYLQAPDPEHAEVAQLKAARAAVGAAP